MELVVFTGIQAVGKSTFFRERFFDTHVRINLDMLRTRHRERLLFEACLTAKQSVAVDNTNVSRSDRARYIVPARAAGFGVVGYYFQSVLAESMARNEARQGRARVPPRGLLGAAGRLETPQPAEGFDALHYVRIERGFVVEPWRPS
ncbi:MAG: AAA family ATPase [Nannocystales bacterium]